MEFLTLMMWAALWCGLGMVFGFCAGFGAVIAMRLFIKDEWGRNVIR